MDFQKYIDQLIEQVVAVAPNLIGGILVIIIGFWIANRITGFAKRSMARTNMDETIQPFLASLLSVGLKVLVLISAAGIMGVETTSFVALFGALAFAVGMALQGSLGHFASGVLLLVFKPYKVGDLVTVGGETGTVLEIQVFNTVLETLDNKRIIVPNGW